MSSNEVELQSLSDKLSPSPEDNPNKKTTGKTCCEPWVLLSIGGMLGLATSNYLNGMLGELGLRVLFYYNVGPLIVCSLYFMAKSSGCFNRRPRGHLTSRNTGIYEARSL